MSYRQVLGLALLSAVGVASAIVTMGKLGVAANSEQVQVASAMSLEMSVASAFGHAAQSSPAGPTPHPTAVSLDTAMGALHQASRPAGKMPTDEKEWQAYAEAALDAGHAYEERIHYSRLIMDLRPLQTEAMEELAEFLKPPRERKQKVVNLTEEGSRAEQLERKLRSALRRNHHEHLWNTYAERVDAGQAMAMATAFAGILTGAVSELQEGQRQADRDAFLAEARRIIFDAIGTTDFKEPSVEVAQTILVHLGILAEHFKEAPDALLFLRVTCEQTELERLAGRVDKAAHLRQNLIDVTTKKCAPEQAARVLYSIGEYYRGVLDIESSDQFYTGASNAAPDTLFGYAARVGSVLCLLEAGGHRAALDRFGKVFEEKWRGTVLVPGYARIAETCATWDRFKEGLMVYRALESDPSYKKAADAQVQIAFMVGQLDGPKAAVTEYRKLLAKYPTSPYADLARVRIADKDQ